MSLPPWEAENQKKLAWHYLAAHYDVTGPGSPWTAQRWSVSVVGGGGQSSPVLYIWHGGCCSKTHGRVSIRRRGT